jgi:pilus assembly protein CpaE
MRILLADEMQARTEGLRRILMGEGLTCDVEDVVGFEALPARLAGTKADLILVAINGDRPKSLAAIRAAHQISEAPILAAGDGATVDAVREAMRAGAREFLEIGRLREELAEALIKIEAEGLVPGCRGAVIAMYSPNGGVGVSTTSINLAERLASARKDEAVALVDLKPAPSDLGLMLDLEPEHVLDQICQTWDRLDQKMLQRAMVRHRSGIHVLAQAGYPENGDLLENTLSCQAVRQLCGVARRTYAVTVLDLPHNLDQPTVEAMRLSSLVGLVARADVPGLQRARWALNTAASLGVPRDRFRLVLNRYGQKGQVDLVTVEEILGIKVHQRIPEDHGTVNKALNRGIPLTELSRMSRISRSFASFARSVQPSS